MQLAHRPFGILEDTDAVAGGIVSVPALGIVKQGAGVSAPVVGNGLSAVDRVFH
jgi:hypothetical protein